MTHLTVYRNGRLINIREGMTKQELKDAGYFVRHPEAIIVKVPSLRTMMNWDDKGTAKAVDGCKVEPDGTCPHGYPSWLLVQSLV